MKMVMKICYEYKFGCTMKIILENHDLRKILIRKRGRGLSCACKSIYDVNNDISIYAVYKYLSISLFS